MLDGIAPIPGEFPTMFFDSLTVAGLFMAVPYALLPWLFGHEVVRVADDGADQTATIRPAAAAAAAEDAPRAAVQAAPCH